jgi:hypothetical protein
MGGDEATASRPAQYALFVERVQDIVDKHGKQLIGWEEILNAKLLAVARCSSSGATTHFRLSCSGRQDHRIWRTFKTYLDMKSRRTRSFGLTWAAIIEVRDAYDWNPGAYVKERQRERHPRRGSTDVERDRAQHGAVQYLDRTSHPGNQRTGCGRRSLCAIGRASANAIATQRPAVAHPRA